MNQGSFAILALRQLRALPNQLTLLRLSIVPFLVLAILDGHYHRAFVLIVVAGVSDGLDGALARLFRQRTELGSYLDPIADKLLLSTLFLVLTHVGLVSMRITVMVFSRDLGIVVISALYMRPPALAIFIPAGWERQTPSRRSWRSAPWCWHRRILDIGCCGRVMRRWKRHCG
jgi:cardiolipin synthase